MELPGLGQGEALETVLRLRLEDHLSFTAE